MSESMSDTKAMAAIGVLSREQAQAIVERAVKLSKADWKPYALIKKMLQNEQKLAKENAETNGWNATEETTAVTEQFCAAVKTR